MWPLRLRSLSFFKARRWPLGNREPALRPRSASTGQPRRKRDEVCSRQSYNLAVTFFAAGSCFRFSLLPTAQLARTVRRARVFFEHSFPRLVLVGSHGGQCAARGAVLVHRLDVVQIAKADGRTRGKDVPVQSRHVEEKRIALLVVGDAAPGGVVPAGV